MSTNNHVSNAVAVVALSVASLAAATVTFAAAANANVEVVSYEKTAMTTEQRESRRSLDKRVQLKQAVEAAKVKKSKLCKEPAPTTCPKEFAVCIAANGNATSGAAHWECRRPAKKYGL